MLAAVAAIALAGCGERPQVISYKQGTYQGKPDTPPWSGAEWGGNKQKWENAIHQRNQAQNDYKRIGG
ncbi:MAG: hypothetical protein KGJ99_03220 [Betaproteobacteria bacterium]|nr:hypothetical protein [Betaproteobacteria bacterium]MDE2002362.1 hypothetical protein [Betaproteobacteria bacterium]MDE2208718.1 hypothetical protein [Betaproteobacteria bacterium]